MDNSDHLIARTITPDIVRGALELEATSRGLLPHRLPGWARAQGADAQMTMAEAQPAGVRLAFRTRARTIELDTIPTKRIYVGAPPRPDGVYDLCVDDALRAQARAVGGDVLRIDMSTGSASHEAGTAAVLRFDGLGTEDKEIEIWLPHNETTELVGLRADAPIQASARQAGRVWLHHGSSISHGSNAEHPTGTWPAIAARLGGMELINLGFGGSALLDPFVARTITRTEADLISLKLGINLVNTDLMRVRALAPAVHGFLDIIRERHALTPLLVVSPILCPIHEDTPGPSATDTSELAAGRLMFRAAGDAAERAAGKLTLNVIRDTLAGIVRQRAASDTNLHYLDGRTLYGEADHEALPLPDRLHPDAATHRLMGERFADLAFGDGRPFRS